MEQVSSESSLGRALANLQGSDDDRARLLNRLAISVGGICVLGSLLLVPLALLGMLDSRLILPLIISSVLSGTVAISTLVLTRLKLHRMAIVLFLYGTVVNITALVYLIGGVGGPVFVAYLLPVMIAGLFGKPGDGVRLFTISLICYMVLAVLQGFQLISPVVPLSGMTSSVIAVMAFGTMGAMLTYLATLVH